MRMEWPAPMVFVPVKGGEYPIEPVLPMTEKRLGKPQESEGSRWLSGDEWVRPKDGKAHVGCRGDG